MLVDKKTINYNPYEDILKPVTLPNMISVEQNFDSSHIENLAKVVRTEVLLFPNISEICGKNVAVGIGSRGINNLQTIAQSLISALKNLGANVYIVPAMGSHGGAIAENQTEILHKLGITQATMGVPIISSMETEVIGYTEDGIPVHMDRNACHADYTVTIARIKPHSSFRGQYESGMVKMCVIGLGKQHGADFCHHRGMANMGENLEKIGKVFVDKSNLLFSLGLIENSYDETCWLKAISRKEMLTKEPKLLEKAKSLLPKIPFCNLDLLVIDEFGKNITGTGMDCNIIQRFTSEHMIANPFIKRLVVLNLTDESDGNASGFGLADISTRRAFEKMSFSKTYPNLLTARTVIGGRIPMIMENDYDAIRAGIKTAPDVDYANLRIVRIKSTLNIYEMEISEALYEDAKQNPNIVIKNAIPYSWKFDEYNNLTTGVSK